MTASEPAAPQEHPGRATLGDTTLGDRTLGDMAMSEKLMAEWEARHDVAARGGRWDPAVVALYLSHVRCEQSRKQPSAAHPHGAGSRTAARGAPAPGMPPAWLRDWCRWGEDTR